MSAYPPATDVFSKYKDFCLVPAADIRIEPAVCVFKRRAYRDLLRVDMKCSVYIATSVDGFIARNDGSVDWLETAGNPNAGTGGVPYIDMTSYMATIDCIIMGRKCMDMISSFDLTPEQWPYGSTRIIVLSSTVSEPPENLLDKVEMYSGDIIQLIGRLENDGHQHAYIDGGTTIQSFINLRLIEEMTITYIPILLGEGKSLFGPVLQDVRLEEAKAVACPSDYVQVHYNVLYGENSTS